MASSRRLLAMVGLGGLALAGLGLLSLFVGSGQLSPAQVWAAVQQGQTGTSDATIVWDLRIPRLPVAVVAGAALGVAGAVTQTLTRNPLAEPGLLGVNAGAALAVAAGLLVDHALSAPAVVALAFAGACGVGIGVLWLGGALRGQHDTVRLVLSGAALSAVASSATSWLILTNPDAFTNFRHWDSGAVAGRPLDLLLLGSALAVGSCVAIAFVQRDLDALALGHDMAGALGVSPRRTWVVAGLAAMTLCAVATALVGPISFLGLVGPLLVRRWTGPRIAPLVVGSAVLSALLLLAADVLGRVVVPPREVAAAIVCSVIGAPVFVAVARRMKVVAL